MAKELAYINRQDLVDTADALRERLNTTSQYTTSMFAEAVRAIQGGSDTEAETPTISVSNSGLITASANGLSATQQLTTQAAKTVTPSTSQQTAVASGVYTTGAVTVAAMPTATLATPTINVSNAGLITATETQTTAGYIAANSTKSATQQLTTKAAATITPGTADQTIAAGTYITGVQTIKGDANLLAKNIMSGVSIFGVSGIGTVQKYYTGASTPVNTIGNNGDLYLVIPSASSDPDGGEDSPIWDEPIDEEENFFN